MRKVVLGGWCGFILAAILISTTSPAQPGVAEPATCICPPPPPCPAPGEPSEAVKKALEAIKAAEAVQVEPTVQQIGPKP